MSRRFSGVLWKYLLVAALAQGGNALAPQCIAPLAPLIQPELGLSKVEIGFFSSAYFIGSWFLLLVGGSLIDRFGIRKMVAAGQIFIGLCLLLMPLAITFPWAVMVMIVAGLGGGVVMPGSTKVISEWFSAGARGTAMGLKQSTVPGAGVLAASTLPLLALAAGWRSAIVAVGIVIAAGGLVTLLLYRDAPRPAQTGEQGPRLREGLARILRNSSAWRVSIVALLFATAQVAVISYLALYLADVVLAPSIPEQAGRVVVAGGYLALCQVGGVFGRVFWGWFSDRYFRGQRMAVMAGIGALAAVMSVLMSLSGPTSAAWFLAIVVFLYGLSAIGWNGLQFVLIIEAVDQRYAATGVGLSMTLTNLGVVAGAPLFGYVAEATGSYQSAWLYLGCLSAATCLIAAVSARKERHGE